MVNNLLTGTYTNKSSYPIPGVVYETNKSFGSTDKVATGKEQSGVEVGYNYLGTRASGTVLLENPETGATYTVSGTSIQTERDGRTFEDTPDPNTGEFELPVGEGGEYEITASHPLLKSHTRTLTFQDGESRPNEAFRLEVPSGGSGFSGGRFINKP